MDYLHQMHVKVTIFRNNEPIDHITRIDYRGIILSPGPGIPETSGNLTTLIRYYKSRLPMLGICLGHQAIGTVQGASLIRAQKPMHGKLSFVSTSDDYLFEGLPSRFRVVRYHSLILDQLPPEIEVIARSDEGEVMAIRHPSENLRGLQFHPEALLTDHGFKILENWINYNITFN